jgi:hypothetical protein
MAIKLTYVKLNLIISEDMRLNVNSPFYLYLATHDKKTIIEFVQSENGKSREMRSAHSKNCKRTLKYFKLSHLN